MRLRFVSFQLIDGIENVYHVKYQCKKFMRSDSCVIELSPVIEQNILLDQSVYFSNKKSLILGIEKNISEKH
jgi:hypothetical protein